MDEKEKLLERKLAVQHCTPLLLLYKKITLDGAENEEKNLEAFVQGVKAKLQELDQQQDLSQLLAFGESDDSEASKRVRSLLEGITCQDLQQLLDCESFKPQVFVSYLKLLSEVNEMQLDCADALQTLFQTGERIPDWASLDSESRDESSGKTIMKELASLDVSKVIVMDPPFLNLDAQTCGASKTAGDASLVFLKQHDESFASRPSQQQRNDKRRQI